MWRNSKAPPSHSTIQHTNISISIETSDKPSKFRPHYFEKFAKFIRQNTAYIESSQVMCAAQTNCKNVKQHTLLIIPEPLACTTRREHIHLYLYAGATHDPIESPKDIKPHRSVHFNASTTRLCNHNIISLVLNMIFLWFTYLLALCL